MNHTRAAPMTTIGLVPKEELAQRIKHVRAKLERAQQRRQPTVNVRVADLDALFSAIWLGQTLALERKARTETGRVARVLKWLREPRNLLRAIRADTLTHAEGVLAEQPVSATE